jgi:hypothetical protein
VSAAVRLPRPSITEWVCLLGGALLGVHYAWFMDDAYVYFRYVDNLLFLRYGLVYNAGEYVEGYSSPLWVLVLALFRTTGMDWWLITRVLAVLSYVAFWALLVALNRQVAPRVRGVRLNLPLCYLTFNYAVASYWTSGLETPLVQVAAVLFALFVLRPESRALQAALAITPILRHELALPFGLCFLWLWFRSRRFPAFLTAATVLTSGAWMLFRVWYYADLFPNTFYLKDTVKVSQGLRYLNDTAWPYHLYPYLGLALLVWFLVKRRRGADEGGAAPLGRERLFMLALALPILAYVIKIGGDPRHYRYLAFPFCLAVCATSGLWSGTLARLADAVAPRAARAAVLVVGLLCCGWIATLYPRQLDSHPFFKRVVHTNYDLINDSAWHRHHPLLELPAWGSVADQDLADELVAWREAHPGEPYDSTIAEVQCIIAYEAYHSRIVHAFGLTDPFLGRMQMDAPRPAHKYGLRPRAERMMGIIRRQGHRTSPGMYRRLVERGEAPLWAERNLERVEVIERKMFNRHDLLENLGLALTFPGPIVVAEDGE